MKRLSISLHRKYKYKIKSIHGKVPKAKQIIKIEHYNI